MTNKWQEREQDRGVSRNTERDATAARGTALLPAQPGASRHKLPDHGEQLVIAVSALNVSRDSLGLTPSMQKTNPSED